MYYNENSTIYFDGSFIKATEAKTDLFGQSLHYGYGVFEGIKSYQTANGTRIFKAKEHFERLIKSAEHLLIPFTYSVNEMTEITYTLLQKNNLGNSYIRPIVICPPNMGLNKAKESKLVIMAWHWDNGYLAGNTNVMTSSFERPNPKAFKIEAKANGHYVNSILASQDAKDKGFDEAILLDSNGFVAESSGANIFVQKGNKFITPPKGNILPGITRATVFDICANLGIEVEEKYFKPEEMHAADSAFFCGTAAEINSLATMDKIPFTLNWEQSLSAIIQKAYRHLVFEEDYLYLKNQVN